MKNCSDGNDNRWWRIGIGLVLIVIGLVAIISGVAQPLSTTLVSEEGEYQGLFARFYGAFIIFCGLCSVFNWTQFGDSGDL